MNEKTFLEKHAAAMVCHRQEYREGADRCSRGEAFAALADYADELAAMVAELEEEEEPKILDDRAVPILAPRRAPEQHDAKRNRTL